MKKLQAIGFGAAGSFMALSVLLGGLPSAHAQTMTSPGVPMTNTTSATGNATGMTPVFYQQNGTAMNPGGTVVPAGNYYNQQGQQIYYYGNGTYYNNATQSYGGQAFGTTPGSMMIAQVTPATTAMPAMTGTGTPALPNTGVGGNALMAVLGIVASLTLAGTGAFYFVRRPQVN